MNLSEVAMLVGFAGIYDLRVQVDELKVRAWAESLDSDIPLEEGKKIISTHYANADSAINPSHINKEWRYRKIAENERKKSEKISLEIDEAQKNKASPEIQAFYLNEIRKHFKKGKDVEVDGNSTSVAPDS